MNSEFSLHQVIHDVENSVYNWNSGNKNPHVAGKNPALLFTVQS